MSDQDVDYKINSDLEIIYKLRNEEVPAVYTAVLSKRQREKYIFSAMKRLCVSRQFRNFSLLPDMRRIIRIFTIREREE